MNEENIVNALNSYDGTQPSLEKTVAVLANEIGPDWMNQVFEQLGNLPVELKEKLDHVFNYYASLTAWQEAQSYLNQPEPLDVETMNERLPILKHWLDFFGQPGQDLYQQLEDRFNQEGTSDDVPPSEEGTSDTSTDVPVETQELPEDHSEKIEEVQEVQEDNKPQPVVEEEVVEEVAEPENIPVAEETSQNEEVESAEEDGSLDDSDENADAEDSEYSDQDDVMPEDNTPEGFAVRKAEREIILLDDLQSWLSARCLQLGDIEIFAYPYYGLVVDLMRQVVKDIQAVLDLENQDIVAKYYPDGLEPLIRKKQAVEADIQTAVENCESDTTALIDKDMDMEKVKKTLGDLDNSTEKEYLGPAPDGFELMDDKPIDEEAVKQQYEQLEETAQKNTQKQDISVTDEKKTSQNEQNSVQRKLSFSLKPKKG